MPDSTVAQRSFKLHFRLSTKLYGGTAELRATLGSVSTKLYGGTRRTELQATLQVSTKLYDGTAELQTTL